MNSYFIVKSKRGDFWLESMAYTKKSATGKFLEGSEMSWRECFKIGWRVVKVKILPIKEIKTSTRRREKKA